jgi:DNA-binding NtrC family response regulator
VDKRLSVLDDNEEDLQLIKAGLERFGYRGTFFSQVEEFEKDLDEMPRIIITDYYLGGRTGVDVMRKVKEKHPICTFIIISSQMSVPQLIDIINVGWGCYFINKDHLDFDEFIKELCNKIDQAKAALTSKLEGVERAKRRNEEIKRQGLEILSIIDTEK